MGYFGSSLFSGGKREDRKKIWNSGTQDATNAKQRPGKQKIPTRKFAAESDLMLDNGGWKQSNPSRMQSDGPASQCNKDHENLSHPYLFSFSS